MTPVVSVAGGVMVQTQRLFDLESLFFLGDNLEMLRRFVPDESVDLVYLDPPFNSNASYNTLFKHADGTPVAARSRPSATHGNGRRSRDRLQGHR